MKKTLILSLLLAGMAQAVTTAQVQSVTVGDQTVNAADGETLTILDFEGNSMWATSNNIGSGESDYTVLTNGRFAVGDGEIEAISKKGTLIIGAGSKSDGVSLKGGIIDFNCGGTVANNLILGVNDAYEFNSSGYSTVLFSNDKEYKQDSPKKLVLTGTITLASDVKASVVTKVNGGGPYIEGSINGSGKTLVLNWLEDGAQPGENYTTRLSGGATLGTLDGTGQVLLDDKKADGTTDAASKDYTMVNATGTGALTVDSGVNLTLTGHATDTALQTTSKSITNNGTIFIGESTPDDTPNTVILSGNVTEGTIQLHSNTNLRIASNVLSSLNMEGSGNAKLIVAETGVVDVQNNFEMDADANTAVEIETGGQFKRGTWTYTNENTTNAVLRRTEVGVEGSKQWSGSSDQFTVTGAKLILTESNWNESRNRLDDCSLVNSRSGEMRVYSAIVDNQLVALDVQSGTVSFRNRTAEEKIGALTLAGGKKVGLYSDNSTDITKITAVQVTDSLTTIGETSATIEASMLTLAEGVTLDFGSSVTLAGDLTMNSNLVLADGMLGEEGVTLFTGVTGLTLATGVYTAPVDAATVFTGVETGTYNLVFSGNVVSLQAAAAVPEPATATLSLLALCGLAARRRRK